LTESGGPWWDVLLLLINDMLNKYTSVEFLFFGTFDEMNVSSLLYFIVASCCKPLANVHTICVRFEVFTAVTMKNGVFWDGIPCGSCKNWRFGGT
jgi:hypothetical protein